LIARHLLPPPEVASAPLAAHREVDSAVHAFRAGGYVVLKKWLQPSFRSTGDAEYARIVAAIVRTMEIMQSIDKADN
jgi:hypothetical protein